MYCSFSLLMFSSNLNTWTVLKKTKNCNTNTFGRGSTVGGKTWLKIESCLISGQSEVNCTWQKEESYLLKLAKQSVVRKQQGYGKIWRLLWGSGKSRDRERKLFFFSRCALLAKWSTLHISSVGPRIFSHTHTPLWKAQGENRHSITPGSHCTMFKK